ncbi:MAG TPA: EscU/YscU/HrcU family type III secretion system export apparatus switch protein [Polyangiaceae bacterium]|nr:EscU/YscU/HrcU family type III secretion system export apparatus switch protein [Polyangiaceae bacterium]
MPNEQRTEPPTPRRLRRARAEGDHPLSAALGSFAALAGAALLLPSAIEALVTGLQTTLRESLHAGAALSARGFAEQIIGAVTRVLGPAALLALAVGFWQTGAIISWKPLGWDSRRLSASAVLTRIWSVSTLVALLRWLGVGLAFGFTALRLLEAAAAALAGSVGSAAAALHVLAELCRRLLWAALAIGAVSAVIDALWARRAWHARLRMTREEVRRERRENDGDEALKQARLSAHRELSQSARLDDLRLAALLVVARPRIAVALVYDAARDRAPRISMQASGRLAETLEALAPLHAVPVFEDGELARELMGVGIDEAIPSALYARVGALMRRPRPSA